MKGRKRHEATNHGEVEVPLTSIRAKSSCHTTVLPGWAKPQLTPGGRLQHNSHPQAQLPHESHPIHHHRTMTGVEQEGGADALGRMIRFPPVLIGGVLFLGTRSS